MGQIIINVLVVLNTSVLVYFHFVKDNFSYSKNETFFINTLLGIQIYYKCKGFLYIPLRNAKKITLKEEVERMKKSSTPNQIQQLGAIFSWLKTKQEVDQFYLNYYEVNPDKVSALVTNWNLKTKNYGL